MKISTKLTLNSTLIVALILLVFTSGIYYFSSKYREKNFYSRLYNKAISTVRLYEDIKKNDVGILKIIDSTTVNMLFNSKIYIYNDSSRLLYANKDSLMTKDNGQLIKEIQKNEHVYIKKDNRYTVGFLDNYKNKNYIVIASATDLYGFKELSNLQQILVFGFIFSLFLLLVTSIIIIKRSLNPISKIIKQVEKFNVSKLNQRLKVRNPNDEIGIMASTFNKMLARIEESFRTERDFISNASHELRTPLTSINGEIEVSLIRMRSVEEYKITLQSIYSEIQDLTLLINGFLQLAESDIAETSLELSKLRIDDLIYQVKEDLLKHNSDYIFNIGFDRVPDDENQIIVMGNKYLLKIMLRNLMDNSCKFSNDKKSIIKIDFNENFVIIRFEDNGIGIPEDEIKQIFDPLYRAENAKHKKGHGIGLSIVKKIVLLHKGNLKVKSKINIGTVVTIQLPIR